VPLTECRTPSEVTYTTMVTNNRSEAAQSGERRVVQLSLLGSFALTIGGIERSLPQGSERLLALLAVRSGALRRAAISGTLWPESDDLRANAALRSTLRRLRTVARSIVESRSGALGLGDDVRVDTVRARGLAERLIEGNALSSDIASASTAILSLDLLPGWYEDWVIVEAEEWHQLRLHALESLSETFTQKGRFAQAISAAMAAVRGDPWRESARKVLVRAHLAENNQSEAIREFRRYRRLLHEELALEPSQDFLSLVEGSESRRRCDFCRALAGV
jgi:SARP family transcriptional regulator, regulator of embCAB operon